MKIYQDCDDWWIGYYRGKGHHYVCLIPTIVIRWRRKNRNYDSTQEEESPRPVKFFGPGPCVICEHQLPKNGYHTHYIYPKDEETITITRTIFGFDAGSRRY